MGIDGRLFGLVSAALVSIFLISSFSIGIVAFQDMNNDGKINIIDTVMSLNRNLVRGDTNNDAKVDIFDLAAVGLAFGSKKGDPDWNPDADVANTVDVVDIFDLATVGKNFDIQNADSPVLDPPISVAPSSQHVSPGDSFSVNITIDSPVGVYAFDIIFFFNPGIVNATGAIEGGFLKKDGASTFPVISIDNTQGKISIANTRFGVATEVTGTGNLATISFTALATGTSNLDLASATLVNSNLQTIAGVTTNNGTVTVGAGCTTHDHFACFDDDVYWYDSCDVKEEKKGECGSDSCGAWGSNYCKEGNVYRSRTCHDRGCSNAACFDNTYNEEQLIETCQYGCSGGECTVPSCMQNSDCGTDGLVGGLFCSNDDVFQAYRTYTCNNPGTANSFCSHADVPTFKEDCGDDYCDDWSSNYCKAGNVYRSRTCYDKGCAASACFSNPWTDEQLVETCTYGCENNACVIPLCVKNSDCGTDGWVGGLSCSNDDVYQNYRTYTCNNPGTSSSYCSSTDTLTLKQDCGNDYCDAWGSNYCKDGDVYRSRTCYDKGCSAGACFNTLWTDEQLVEGCAYGCQNGKCLLSAAVNIPAGVSIFSLPLIPAGGSITFNQLGSNCNVLVNGINSSCAGPNLAYPNPDTGAYICVGLDNPLYPGQGYFIKVADACSFTIIGANLPSSQIGYLGTGQLKTGWNLIGAPTYQTDFNRGTCQLFDGVGILKYGYDIGECGNDDDCCRIFVEGYNGGYAYCNIQWGIKRCRCEVDYFEQGLGYWLRTGNYCSLY